jgi:hypothetical protein
MTKSAAAPFPPEIVTPEIVSVAKKLRMGNDWLPLIANEDAPGPEMLILVLTLSVPDVSWIVDGFGSAKTIVSPFRAVASSALSVPGPLSAVLVTVNVLGSERSSSRSMIGRNRDRATPLIRS